MLNIVVPMAGRGQRFVDAGYDMPKPLVSVLGTPMIELVIANLVPKRPHRFHFLARREQAETHGLARKLAAWAPGSTLTLVDAITEGAVCTILLARDMIAGNDPLMIANCDQYVDADIDAYLGAMGDADGLIMTMWAEDPKWSFVRRDAAGRVVEVVEKVVVSNEATVGIYNFRRGTDFMRAADAMIAADFRVNGEFYVAPTYNHLIREGAKIRCHGIGRVGAEMHGLGTPQDLEGFLATDACRRAVEGVAAGRGAPR